MMTDAIMWLTYAIGMAAGVYYGFLVFRSVLFRLDQPAPYKESALCGLIFGLFGGISLRLGVGDSFPPFAYPFYTLSAAVMMPTILFLLRKMLNSQQKVFSAFSQTTSHADEVQK